MRKYIIGAIAGALFVLAGQVAADSISLVGKKVQGEAVVKVDGIPLEVKGLIVDGLTNVPARAFANASGFDIKFENKEVLLTRKESGVVHNVPEIEQAPHVELEDLPAVKEPDPEYTIETITKAIDGVNRELVVTKVNLKLAEDGNYAPEDILRIRIAVQELESKLERLEAIKSELQAKQ